MADTGPPTIRRIARRSLALTVVCLAAAAALLGFASPAHGAVGTYAVTLSTTNGDWVPHLHGDRIAASHNRIYVRAGTTTAGSWGEWRISLPSSHLSFRGGLVRIGYALPRTELRARVRTGSGGGATRTLISTRSGTAAEVLLPRDVSWFGFGVHAADTARPGTNGANQVTFRSARLEIDDSAAPTLTVSGAPSPGAWIGPACRELRAAASDAGSGVRRIRFFAANGATSLGAGAFTSDRILQPGARSATRTTCLSSSRLAHGTHRLRVEAEDVAGRLAITRPTVLVDARPPRLSGLPANDTAFRTGRPEIEFEVTDDGSGVATVTASIDDIAVPVLRDGRSVSVKPAEALPIGAHTLTVRVSDAAGHVTAITRRFDIGDLDAPTVSILAPEPTGGTRPVVVAAAEDEVSGVDPASWRVAVDGVAVGGQAEAGRFRAPVGRLTAGPHRISVTVRDFAGNRRSTTLAYTARIPGGTLAAQLGAVGAATGVRIRMRPAGPVGFAGRARFVVIAARSGRPVSHQAVVARLGGSVAGRATTDANGVAVIRVRSVRPGPVVFSVPGAGIPATRARLAVRPRVGAPGPVRTARVGTKVRVSGRIRPGSSIRRAALQARVGAEWYTVKSGLRVRAGGIVRTSVTSAVAAKVRLRFVVPAQRGWARGVGRAAAIRFRG